MERLNKLNIYIFGKCLNKYHKWSFEYGTEYVTSFEPPLVKYYKGLPEETEKDTPPVVVYKYDKETKECKICGEKVTDYKRIIRYEEKKYISQLQKNEAERRGYY